jgi:hypothetical protein
VGEGGPRLGGHEARRRVDDDSGQTAEVQHEAVRDRAVPGDVVATAPHGQRQAGAPGGRQDEVDVGHGPGAGEGSRTDVDHAVPDPSCVVVAGVVRADQGAGEVPREVPEGPIGRVVGGDRTVGAHGESCDEGRSGPGGAAERPPRAWQEV